MYTKVQIFNLALGALLLKREISDADADTSYEARVVSQYYDSALNKTLADLDLNITAVTETLSLVEDDVSDFWEYAYAYPSNCVLVRRIVSCVRRDDRYTRIPFETGQYGTPTKQKVIFTNEAQAELEYIANDLTLTSFSADTGLAIAHQLAFLSAPILVGKGADKVKDDIYKRYLIHKTEAQETDRMESPLFDSEESDSEFVKVRLS